MDKLVKGAKRLAYDTAARAKFGNGVGRVISVITPGILKERLVDMKARRVIKK